jgi:glycosyltransferase involved in cell wall biosynthesis
MSVGVGSAYDIPRPFFSVCVPQFNRTTHLRQALEVLARQTYQDFEVCVSDDCSTDGRSQELEAFLERMGIRYKYRLQERNVRYDANLRTAIDMAVGRYCLLMGNDDCLADEHSLERLHSAIAKTENTGVVIVNYSECGDGRVYRRVSRDGPVGSGPAVAVGMFRDLSFVSGIVLRTDRAQAHSTAAWDGSEMYQMFLGCRIVAEGYQLVELRDILIHKDIMIAGEEVDSYVRKPRLRLSSIREMRIPLVEMGRLVHDAIGPYCGAWGSRAARKIFLQILFFTYPFWLVEYRRVQSWRFAAGISLGMRPRNLLPESGVSGSDKFVIRFCYCFMTFVSLLVPTGLFGSLRQQLYVLAKSSFLR